MAKRLTWIGLLAVLVCVFVFLKRDRPPELIVLITVDTLRADHLSTYGYDRETSPHLDRLREDAILYSLCFSSASSTAPSIASIFTSTYPSRHGVTEFFTSKLDDDAQTLAELLSREGYLSAAFIGNPVLASTRNFGQGFSVYDETMSAVELNRQIRERTAVPLTDAALGWLRRTTGPRFLWLHYQDPHGPYYPPASWRQRFEPRGGEAERRLLPVLADHSGRGGIPAYQRLPGRNDAGYYVAMYDSEIGYLDSEIGRLINSLRQSELYDDSLIVLTADHGEAFGEEDYYFGHGHGSTPDQTRVPLIVKLPGGPGAENRSTIPISTLDILPTVLSVAGVDVPQNVQGAILPPLSDRRRAHPLVYTETKWHHAIVTNRRYYVRDKPQRQAGERNPISGGAVTAIGRRLFEIDGDRLLAIDVDEVPAVEVERLEAALSYFYRSGPEEASQEIPQATRELLESLGYLN